MRQIPSDKYTVAWFKLADFVARGEKERALGLYRLLMHSIDDEALSHQLAGDLLLSFSDAQAAEKYSRAAQLYKEQNRLLQAAAVYEQVLALLPQSIDTLTQLYDLYLDLRTMHKAIELAQKLCLAYVSINEKEAVIFGKKAIDSLMATNDHQLQEFLSEVRILSEVVHKTLCDYLQR